MMKIKYSPNGPGKKPAPKNWEVWLADAPFGPGGKTKRCPVAVGKRTSAGWTVYEIIPSGERGGKDAVISDLMKAGQDRPSAVHVVPATVQQNAFVQRMGELAEADIGKVLAGLR
jgi:mRNA interferase MazF